LEGAQLATEWIRKPTVLESGCLNIVKVSQVPVEDSSRLANLIKIAQDLDKYAKRMLYCAVWRASFLACISELLKLFSNLVSDKEKHSQTCICDSASHTRETCVCDSASASVPSLSNPNCSWLSY
ncbi:hypothetical protein BAE44_0008020, partial [Dichanthelium oligosanthes]